MFAEPDHSHSVETVETLKETLQTKQAKQMSRKRVNKSSCKEVVEINEKISSLMEQYSEDVTAITILTELKDLLESKIYKFMNKNVKKSRNNANTGLGISRPLSTPGSDFYVLEKGVAVKDSNRSEMTSIISNYVKRNDLQVSDKKLYFRMDKTLCNLFVLKSLTMTQLQKYMEVGVVKERIMNDTTSIMKHIKENGLSNESNIIQTDSYLQDLLSLQPDDLISWRELQKILFLNFQI